MRRDELVQFAETFEEEPFPLLTEDRNQRSRPHPSPNEVSRAIGSGRRRNWKPMHPVTLLLAQLWMGLSLGATWAGLVFAGTRAQFPERLSQLPDLAILSPLLALAVLGLIRWQIRSIREQTFRRKIGGKPCEVHVRRRGEVLTKIAFRGLGWTLVAVALFLAIHAGISYYRLTVVAGLPFVFTIPRIGDDLVLVAVALAVTLLGLLPVEGVFRVSNKQGYPAQGLALFLPAALAFALVLHWLPGI